MALLDYGAGGLSPAFSCTYVANGTFQYYPAFIVYPGGVNYSLNPAQFTPKDGSSSRTCGLVHSVGSVDDCTFGPAAK
jgi:hypothetical protein